MGFPVLTFHGSVQDLTALRIETHCNKNAYGQNNSHILFTEHQTVPMCSGHPGATWGPGSNFLVTSARGSSWGLWVAELEGISSVPQPQEGLAGLLQSWFPLAALAAKWSKEPRTRTGQWLPLGLK